MFGYRAVPLPLLAMTACRGKPAAISPIRTGAGMDWIRWISIHEGKRVNRIAYGVGQQAVSRSRALARFEEASEFDGETGRLSETQGGLRFANIHHQGRHDPAPTAPAQGNGGGGMPDRDGARYPSDIDISAVGLPS